MADEMIKNEDGKLEIVTTIPETTKSEVVDRANIEQNIKELEAKIGRLNDELATHQEALDQKRGILARMNELQITE